MNYAVLVLLLVAVSTADASERNIKERVPRRSFLQARTQSSAGVSVVLQTRSIREKQRKSAGWNKRIAYFGPLSVGSPGKEFLVVFDTGSGNLMIPGSNCNNKACDRHRRFDVSNGGSAKQVSCFPSYVWNGKDPKIDEYQIKVVYGTGTVTGQCYNDKICLGGACSLGDFIVSTEESDAPFASVHYDGVLGLGLPSMAQAESFHMMQRMTKQEALKQPLFSVFLSNSDDETSEVTFGAIKHEHMASDLFWVPVTGTTGHWQVKIDDITFGSDPLSLCQNCRVSIDTGTSKLAGPTEVIEELNKKLDVRSDCGNYYSLPHLGFIIGGKVMQLEPRDYIEKDGDIVCAPALYPLDVPPPNGPLFILGIPFLQKYYSVYDHENSKVGFAVAKHTNESPASLLQIG